VNHVTRRAGTLLAGVAMLVSLPVSAQPKGVPAPVAEAVPSAIGYVPHDKVEEGIWLEMEEQERDLKRSRFVIQDPALNAYVREVLCRTVGTERCGAARIYLMRTPYFNANMAPNGMMQVWSGLLLRCRNEAQLAAILGHEFTHFERQHTLKQFKDVKSRIDTASWLSFLPYGVGLIAQIGVLGGAFSYSRDMEREADRLGVEEMVRAGYDPREAMKIWQQLGAEMDETARVRGTKSRKDKNGGFFATHPKTSERMETLAMQSSHVMQDAVVKPVANEAEYHAALNSWWPDFVDDQIKLNDFGGTEFVLGMLASDGWTPDLLYARGELYRTRGREGDFAKAVEFFQQAVTRAGAPVQTWRGLGLARLRLGQGEEGSTALKEYLRLAPDAKDATIIGTIIGGTGI